uniref:Uncharacterized protein n=1 Tax=Oryza rufipogon TaxID=4529 RepID=A0A0E0RK21_ORYRU
MLQASATNSGNRPAATTSSKRRWAVGVEPRIGCRVRWRHISEHLSKGTGRQDRWCSGADCQATSRSGLPPLGHQGIRRRAAVASRGRAKLEEATREDLPLVVTMDELSQLQLQLESALSKACERLGGSAGVPSAGWPQDKLATYNGHLLLLKSSPCMVLCAGHIHEENGDELMKDSDEAEADFA